MRFKPLNLFAALGLTLSLTLPALLPALAAEPPAHEGYLVQLKGEVQTLSGEERGNGLLVVDTLAEAKKIPAELVDFIEPNYLVELFDTDLPPVPNDPYYADSQWNLDMVHAYSAALAGLTGKGVKVGFVDSGVNGEHEDLNPARLHGMDFIPVENEENGIDRDYDEDNMGHGTFVCGLVGAQTNNGVGLAGIAPEAELYAYRVFDKKTTTMAQLVQAIDQAVADGCQILNLSLGSQSRSGALQQAVIRAQQAGTIVVAAVGNSGSSTLMYPAGLDGVIGVGSVDRDLRRSTFSQHNESVDFTAPGGGVAGLGFTAPDDYRLDLNSNSNKGTSFATPVVTALIALMLDYAPGLTSDSITTLLANTAHDLGKPGYDTDFGWGVVDGEKLAAELMRPYSITYETAGGTVENAPEGYTVHSETVALPVPQRGEDEFLGWYLSEDCTGEVVTEIPAGSVGDRTFYAKWEGEEPPAPLEPVDPPAPPEPLPFTDVGEEDWFAPYVRHVWERGIMSGTGEGKFSPAASTDRAMVVTMLYQMKGKPEVSGELTFADVEPGDWFHDAVLWAVQSGVSAGYGPTRFGAEDPVLREQLALMLYNFAEKPPVEGTVLTHPDGEQVSPYARTAMEWAVENGILSGTDGGLLLPGGISSRAETAAMFTAFSKLMGE